MRKFAPLLLVVAGCARPGRMMPLEIGKSWTYSVYNGYATTIEPVRVEGRTPVGPVEGFLLGGPMGPSALGWDGGELLASRMANASFDPPLPIGLDRMPLRNPLPATWRGTIEAFGRRRPATANLFQSRETITVGGASMRTARADVRLRLRDGTSIELSTWFRPGDGIVKQEQRTNRRHVVTLTRLDAS